MSLLARVIKSMGVKMVLSGEGADEIFGGYLYFHKAPDARAFHEETVRKIGRLHQYDCLRANKSLAAWGGSKAACRSSTRSSWTRPCASHPKPNAPVTDASKSGFCARRSKTSCRRRSSGGRRSSSPTAWATAGSTRSKHSRAAVSDREMAQAADRFPVNPPRNKGGVLLPHDLRGVPLADGRAVRAVGAFGGVQHGRGAGVGRIVPQSRRSVGTRRAGRPPHRPGRMTTGRTENPSIYDCSGSKTTKQMKVLKFGGSSVGSAQGLRQVRRIVAANDGQIVVVVSALGGITDRLLATAAAAAAGKPDYTDSLAEIVARHRTTIDETVASERRGAIRRRTDELLDELANILRGVYLIRDLSPRTGDAIVSYGERLSSGIVAAVLEGSRLYDAREFIRTKTDFRKAHRRTGSDRKAHQGASGRPPPRVGSAGLHRLGLRHGRRDQSGARRIGLHRRTHRRRAERRDARNLDRRRRFHDGRPASSAMPMSSTG